MAEIHVFQSHIEVYPYQKGDSPKIEKTMSKFVKLPHAKYYEPLGFYIENDTLYLPRGFSASILENEFHTSPVPVSGWDSYTKFKSGVPLFDPKTLMQTNAIKFLCGEEDFAYSMRFSQLGLNLATGDGKTFSTVTAILKYKLKSIIITHQTKIKNQWIKTFQEMTTFPEDRLCDIHGIPVMEQIMKGEIKADIYLVNHQTIAAYARKYSWQDVRDFFKKIKVGIKVIDEAHRFFENSFMIDNFSNTYKSFYLTATFGRTDTSEITIYKRAYSSLARFGEETIHYKEKRKHTICVFVFFQSKPPYGIIPRPRTGYGFSSYKYIDYELYEETNHSLEKVIAYILKQTQNLEGKTLITSPKKESVVTIESFVKGETDKSVGTIFSDNNDEENEENKGKDIISSTIKSVGEGTDIKNLRILIEAEPIGSKDLAIQVCGRLREYAPDKDTYLFYPVDLTIPDCYNQYKRLEKTFRKICKEIIYKTVRV